MDAIFDALRPRPCTWFQCSGVYDGDGTVFSDTLGRAIGGRFSVQWNDLGDVSIQCIPNNLELHECLRIADDFDKFHDLEVVAESGSFSARQCYLSGETIGSGQQGGYATLRFSILAGSFVSSDNDVPSIWNASLTNFIMNLRHRPGAAERHPLRIFQKPIIPDTFPGDKLPMARLIAESKNRIAVFEFNGSMAFIEHLADYEEAKSDLENHRSPNRATSMMVGTIPTGAGLEPEDVQKWFPIDVLFGLTFASGSGVGLGVIDLRSQQGQMCARIHLSAAAGRYSEDHVTLSDLIHSNEADSGLGPFLTCLLKGNDVALGRFRRLAAAIDLAQQASETPEHSFAFIVRALDGLANDLKLSKSNLRAELSSATSEQVKAILLHASKTIRRLSKPWVSAADAKTQATLDRIADRTLSADSTDDKFGLSLGRILGHYRLDDEIALASFYTRYPRPDGFAWTQVLDVYRGEAIHRGFIDYSAGREIRDVACITRHLLDIAIRICFREIGYVGTYNPLNMTAMQQSPVDWVKSEKEIGLFGYNGRIPKMINFVEIDKPS